jgi:hypothetical protein
MIPASRLHDYLLSLLAGRVCVISRGCGSTKVTSAIIPP